MKRLLVLTMVVVMVACFIGCGTGYFVSPDSLKEAIVYLIGANGYDNITFTPSEDTELSGTYQVETYSYNYPSEALSDTGLHTNKEYFQTGGRRGTYTYDAETMELTLTTDEVYRLTDAAVTAGTEWEVDYNWLELEEADNVETWAENYVQTETFTAAFTQDNLLGGISNLLGEYSLEDLLGISLVYVKDADATTETWIASGSRTLVNGDQISESFTFVFDYTDPENMTLDYEHDYTETPNGAASADIIHYDYNYSISLEHFFIAGQLTGDTTIANAWVKDNILTLKGTATSQVIRSWTGSTAPTEDSVSVDDATGVGIYPTTESIPEPGDGSTDGGEGIVWKQTARVPFNAVVGNQDAFIYHAKSNIAGRSIF